MYIYLSHNTIFVLIFIVGLVLGAIIHRRMTKPKIPKWAIDYDGTNGKGYQPLANQGQQPMSQKSELPPLKKPKKGSDDICWVGPVPLSRRAPPKPLHNPNK